MGLNPTGGVAPAPASVPGGYQTGQHYDAAGNLVDINGNIIKPADQVARDQAAGQTYVNQENAAGAPGVFGNQTAQTILTKDNPVAGSLNAISDLANGNPGQAASDFGAGTSGGTLPQLDGNGNIIPGDTISAAAGAAGLPSGIPGITSPVTGPGGADISGLLNGLGGLVSPSTGGIDQASADAQALEKQFMARLNGLQPGQVPQLDPTQQAQFRDAQMGLVGNLQGVLNGSQPSVAQIQQNQAFDQLRAQQQGQAAAAARGGNQALAMRTAANNLGTLGAQQASASALLRAQEQTTARGQLGDVTNSGRTSDIGLAGANQNSAINTRAQDITQQSNLGNQALQANSNDVNAQTAKFNQGQQKLQTMGNLVSTGAGVLSMLSDRRLKEDIEPESTVDIRDFLNAIKPSAYRYKGAAEPKVGVMAQDVERSGMGRTIVKNTPIGKAIDIPSATGAMLASLADLNRRLAKVESGK
jgi:hypothetical protein